MEQIHTSVVGKIDPKKKKIERRDYTVVRVSVEKIREAEKECWFDCGH